MAAGTASTFASGLSSPGGVAFGPDGLLYVGCRGDDTIRRYNVQTGVSTTFASNVGGYTAGLAFSPDGSSLYVGSTASIYRFDMATGTRAIFATDPGHTNGPFYLTFGPDGDLYASDQNLNDIRRYDVHTGDYTVFASGPALIYPEMTAVSPDGKDLYLANYGANNILCYDLQSGTSAVFAGATAPMGLAFGPITTGVPEPRSVALLLAASMGLLGLVLRRRRCCTKT